MTPIRIASLAAIAACFVTLAAQASDPRDAFSAGLVEDEGGSQRIDMSGKLRMLSQRIPASACNLEAGVATDVSGPMMAAATAEFQRIVTALELGDDGLGIIGAEDDRRVLYDLAALKEVWGDIHGDASAMSPATITEDDVASLADRSAELLTRAKRLVPTMVGEYADPAALLQANAITIDIAGRQRMLAQRISKNACLLASGHAGDAAVAEMEAAMSTYDVSLNALRFGMDEAGIVPPPVPQIEEGLAEIAGDWQNVQPLLARAAGGDLSLEERAQIFTAMNGLTGKMNVLVGVYAEVSKLGL